MSVAAQEGTADSTISPDQPFIVDSIDVRTSDVFEGLPEYAWLHSIASPFHQVSRKQTILNEVFVSEGDTATRNDLDEIERNLRGLAIFGTVEFDLVPSPWIYHDEPEGGPPHVVLRIRTRDTWSLRVYGSFQQTEDDIYYGGTISEGNLLGRANVIGVTADYSSYNDRGWIFGGFYLNPNIAGSHLQFGGSGYTGRNLDAGALSLGIPFYSDRVRDAFSASLNLYNGQELSYLRGGSVNRRLSTEVRSLSTDGWYARSNGGRVDAFRASVAVGYNRTRRDSLESLARAFENSASVFIGLSSQRRKYVRVTDADFDGIRQVPVGASGSVSIGKIAPHHGGNDNVVYIGADAYRATLEGDFYAWGGVAGGTGLAGKKARFTSLRFAGSATWLAHPGAVSIFAEQSTVWNWDHYIDAGARGGTFVRGHSRDDLVGDNRFQVNIEYRLNPIVRIFIFDIGATLFTDIGGVWDQGSLFSNTRFRSSAGIGLRFSTAAALIRKGLFRIDLARTFDNPALFRLIIGTTESFDFGALLDYRPPAPYTY